MPAPLSFVSYRRADSSAAARWLASSIGQTFGAQCVFIDTEAIRIADDWTQLIDRALAASTLLLPVIGPRWLSITDSDHRRRIDDPEDWVHREILHALQGKIRVLPVLLSRTPMPTARALPPAISALSRYQAFELRDERWESDLGALLVEMEQFGFKRAAPGRVRYPPPMVQLTELTAIELKQSLENLPQWSLANSELPGAPGRQRIELHRSYEFASFEDAIRFMQGAAPRISSMEHHPRWENIWRTVSVWLSTWDIGHRPSTIDLELAAFLDTLYDSFKKPAPKE